MLGIGFIIAHFVAMQKPQQRKYHSSCNRSVHRGTAHGKQEVKVCKRKTPHLLVRSFLSPYGDGTKWHIGNKRAVGFSPPYGDGHEWMRAKWSAPIRKYWKISEQMMVKYCDLAICDSVNIEKYIHECYDGKGIKGRNPKTTFIAYGADLTLSKLADDDEKLVNWYKENGLTKKDYYLVVGRFVPENSFEVMIREFMKSKSKKNFAIITNVNEKFLNELEEKLHFKSDKRIKFVGTVYDQELLKKIRENAYAYFHGHTVGGTNPSLIEALGSTDLNLLVDVSFNKEVAEDCALYWSCKPGSLAKLIDKADQMSADQITEMGWRAKKRVAEEYTWDKICGQYEDVFLKYKKN